MFIKYYKKHLFIKYYKDPRGKECRDPSIFEKMKTVSLENSKTCRFYKKMIVVQIYLVSPSNFQEMQGFGMVRMEALRMQDG